MSFTKNLSHMPSGVGQWDAEPFNSWKPNSQVPPRSEILCTRLTFSSFFWFTDNGPSWETFICEKKKEANVLLISQRHLANVEQLVGKSLGLYCQLLDVKIKNGGQIGYINWRNISSLKLLNTTFINFFESSLGITF